MKILLISQYANELEKNLLPDNPILHTHFKNYHRMIYQTLIELGYDIILSDGLDNEILLQKILTSDLVFPIRADYGYTNGDLQIRLFCQKYHKRIVGGTSYSKFYESDKIVGKLLCENMGIKTPNYKLPYQIDELQFNGPYLVKPRFTGSSINLSDNNIIANKASLKEYFKNLSTPQDFYIEQFISGVTATIGCIIGESNKIIMGIPYTLSSKTHLVLTYEDKKNGGCIRGYVKDDAIKKQLEDYCATLFKALQPCQFARFDFILSEKSDLYFLEINETPNLSITGGFVQAFLQSNFSTYENFINHLIKTAIASNK